MKVLVTGAAGFIGYHVAHRLAVIAGNSVLGIDNLCDYYDVALKRARLARLAPMSNVRFEPCDCADRTAVADLMTAFRPDYVVHLGAQAGVRYSMQFPNAYTRSNLDGFGSILEACRATRPKRLVYASSSSVYGAGARPPFREDDNTDQPVSYYAATKKANELMAYSFAHNHHLDITGLRFFTVYGPWGRPDMAPTIIDRAICEGTTLKLFNGGKNLRDFTYIDDIVEGVIAAMLCPPQPNSAGAARIFNLGNHRAVETLRFVELLQDRLGQEAKVELLPPQPGDMFETCADLTRVRAAIGFSPKIALEEGLTRFVAWFREYYQHAAPRAKLAEIASV